MNLPNFAKHLFALFPFCFLLRLRCLPTLKHPQYLLSGLADSYFFQVVYAGRTIDDLYQRELLAAQKALELDDTLAEAHTSMGRIIGNHGWDWASGEEHYKRAIELNPNYVQAHLSYGNHLARHGRLDEAISEMKKAVELDPVSINSNTQLGRLFLYNRQYDAAIEQIQRTYEELEGYPNLSYLVFSYWYKGMYEEAIEWAEKMTSIGGDPIPTTSVFLRQVASGDRADAIRTIENWELGARGKAQRYAFLGEKDLAIEWLTKSVDERNHGATWAGIDSRFDPLRSDPRFQDLLRRMNLVP